VSRLDWLRHRLAWWLMPRLSVAEETRRLEKIAHDKGASRSCAKALASEYFRTLKRI
jgi:hypothetical protein